MCYVPTVVTLLKSEDMFNRTITFLIFMLMVLTIMAQQPATGDSIVAQALDET